MNRKRFGCFHFSPPLSLCRPQKGGIKFLALPSQIYCRAKNLSRSPSIFRVCVKGKEEGRKISEPSAVFPHGQIFDLAQPENFHRLLVPLEKAEQTDWPAKNKSDRYFCSYEQYTVRLASSMASKVVNYMFRKRATLNKFEPKAPIVIGRAPWQRQATQTHAQMVKPGAINSNFFPPAGRR